MFSLPFNFCMVLQLALSYFSHTCQACIWPLRPSATLSWFRWVQKMDGWMCMQDWLNTRVTEFSWNLKNRKPVLFGSERAGTIIIVYVENENKIMLTAYESQNNKKTRPAEIVENHHKNNRDAMCGSRSLLMSLRVGFIYKKQLI